MKIQIPDAEFGMVEVRKRKYLDAGDLEAWIRYTATSFQKQGAPVSAVVALTSVADVIRGAS